MKKENLYLDIINNLHDGVYCVDLDRRVTFWNQAAEKITGYRVEEMIGRKCADNILNHIDEEGRPLCLVGCPLFAAIIDGRTHRAEVFLRRRDGRRIPVLVNIFPMIDDGQTIGAIEIFTPNSPVVYQDDLVRRLSEMAMKDRLTGLPNRRYLESFLELKLSELSRFGHLFAVLFMDIDNFSLFNNNYGHGLGDAVLRSVAGNVQRNVRQGDLFGRWGGEEFVGIFNIRRPADALGVGEKVRGLTANTKVPYGEDRLSVTASIGVAVAHDGDTMVSLVEKADELMYRSKCGGKNRTSTAMETPADCGTPAA